MTTKPARTGGALTIGGDLRVYRLGFGASMRITGDGVWGTTKRISKRQLRCYAVRLNWASI